MSEAASSSYQYAFLDSGTGGLPYLRELARHADSARAVYVADTAHFPYGEKTRDDVIHYAVDTTARLIERFSPSVVIVACNTISVAALSSLRQRFPVPFVGTVPAIKQAALKSKNRRIGLLATERTVRDPYTDDLIEQWASDCTIVKIGDSRLISRIEGDLITASTEERINAVRPSIDRFVSEGCDTIVLACTHFLHVSEEIALAAGEGVAIIDSREGVVHQALRLSPPSDSASAARAFFYTGGAASAREDQYKSYAALFTCSWGGLL